ncbi:hypothetical protein J4Q44_G00038110 [Coregonus suidteri]|uniref:NACHT domain-containing protein n=1 Tax=Coregonus suidteri TaxID=861788 RepID=A0AAN8R5P4_9TELE
MSLEDLLFNMYSEPQKSKEEVLQDIKENSENVVIIFDGITDLSSLSVVKELMENLLPDAKIVTTCRPDQSEDFLTDWPADWFRVECLYEHQSTEACLLLLDKLDYHLDLSGEHLDPHQCCAVSYVTSQSAERKVGLDLNDCIVSDQGVRLILGSLKNVRHLGPSSGDSSDPSMLCQLWTTLLSSVAEMDFTSLLGLCGNELHLPVQGERRVFERAEEVMKQSLERVHLCLHWGQRTLLSEALSKTILDCLSHINKLRFTPLEHQRGSPERLETEEKAVLLDLCLQAALDHRETFQRAVNTLLSLFSVYQTERYDILLDLYSHVKYNRNQTARSVLPSLKPLYQSAPAVWSIDLSERKASLLLEVLKLQPGKKSLELKDWSDEESEVRSFLQCLPYISQLRSAETPTREEPVKLKAGQMKRVKVRSFLQCLPYISQLRTMRLKQAGVSFQHYRQFTSQLLQFWSIDLSERKASLLLEVLKLQPEKKPVELKGWSDEESEVRSFLQCLLYISQLSGDNSEQIDFLLDLYSHVKDYETQTGRSVLPALQPVYQSAPAVWSIDLSERKASLLLEVLKLQPEKKPVELKDWSDEESEVRSFLQCLPLHLTAEDYETQTGRSVLPALQPVYQSAPAVWSIDLSKRKASLLLEVLKLQPEKKPVKLKGWSDEESEVRSFLQCLPYISQLSFRPPQDQRSSPEERTKREKIFLLNLCLQAALHERGTIQTTVEKLLSLSKVYRYQKCDFLLDLYSHVKDYETQTGRSVLPALQPVYQSAPAVWSIDLSKRKASLLLEVLKLQPEKKPVELKGWSDEESELDDWTGSSRGVCESVPCEVREEDQQLASTPPGLGLHSCHWEESYQENLQVCGGESWVSCASRVDLTLTPSKISLQ